MDLWVVREFWHILDNTHFYLQQPELMFGTVVGGDAAASHRQQVLSQQALRALREWEQIRIATDLSGLKLFWVGDALGASLLPESVDSGIVWRWETLARSLEAQQTRQMSETLAAAYRDAAALAVAIGSAFILTYQLPEERERQLSPGICAALESWDIACQPLAVTDPIAAIERDQLRYWLVATGLSKLLWAGLHLCVLHLVVPAAASLNSACPDWSEEFLAEELLEAPPVTDLWKGAQGFWYSL